MGRIIFFIIFTLLLLLPDLYLYFSKVHLSFPEGRPRKAVKWLYFITLALQFGGMVFLYFHKKDGGEMTSILQVLDSFVKTMYIIKLGIIIPILLLGDLYKGGEQLIRLSQGADSLPERVAGRRNFIKQTAVLVASVPFLGFLYGMTWGKYRFQVRKVTLTFDDLPPAFDGFRLAQFSDFHAGSFDSVEGVRKGLQALQAQAADLIVFTGDLVNSMAQEMDPFTKEFAILNAPFGVYACTGNHDYGYRGAASRSTENRNQVMEKYAEAHLTLLNNEHVKLEKDGQHIRLMGVENWGAAPYFPKKGDLDGTLAEVPAEDFKILLSHDPTHWDAQVNPHPKKVHLTLSGHTHGTQMGVELFGMKWAPGKFVYKQWAGLYEKAGEYLYVNRGFGMLEGFYMRVGMYPEITLVELKRK